VLNVTLFGLCGALLLSCRWPAGWAWVQIAVVILLTLQCWRNARRLQQRCGALMLDDKGDWYWRGERWQAQRQPDWLPWGVLLVLRNRRGQRWRRPSTTGCSSSARPVRPTTFRPRMARTRPASTPRLRSWA